MLGNTGYEGRFDFPARAEPPAIAYILASVPRSGSTFVSHLLWETGCLGAPLEYLNFEPGGPYGFASRSPEQQRQLWKSVVRRRTSPNGVFGAKLFPMQLQALEEGNPELLADAFATLLDGGKTRVVWLGRRDPVAHAISYARASLSGIWRKEQEGEGGTGVQFSVEAVDRAQRQLAAMQRAWDEMFEALAIRPLRLWYEDVVAEPDAAVAAVADVLGVHLDPAARVAVPAIERQSGDQAEWRRLYAEARAG